MRARNELRQRWRGLLSLALIAGIGGGAALAAVAGARRTEDVYPRFLKATNAFDSVIGVTDDSFDPKQIPLIESAGRLPLIKDSSVIEIFAANVTGPNGVTKSFPDLFPIASPDGKLGHTLNRVKLIAGRLSNNDAPDEAMMNPIEAQHLGAHVGSILTADLYTLHVKRKIRLVGIGLFGGQIDPSAGGYLPLMLLTRAFYQQNANPAGFTFNGTPALVVSLHGGRSSIPALQKQVPAFNPHLTVTALTTPQDASVKRSAHFQEVGFDVFAGLAALTILAIFAQLLARQIFLESSEHSALRALGMTRTQMAQLAFIRVMAVAIGAAAIATIVAIALSPLFPIGLMRELEVDTGIRVDTIALVLGAAAVILSIVLTGAIPAWRSSSGATRRARPPGTNRAANALAGASFPPTAVSGVRMALEPGHGSSAVPVRTTIFGTVLALVALTASLSFGASIQKLVSSPRLSGWNFDAIASVDSRQHLDQLLAQLRANGTIATFVKGDVPDIKVGGTIVNVLAFDPGGAFGPTIISGRAPEGPKEIVLGARLIRKLHSAIGQLVPITALDPNGDQPLGAPVLMRIVGSTITPQFFFAQTGAGNSAAVSEEFTKNLKLDPNQLETSAYVRFSPGISVDAGVARINAASQGNAFVIRRSE
ncbi:MAG TPA: ABC transporter permease, partial [Tepidisphaeraceae bacterium]|nr:ABC transporter permease [Tepidisphaeraceae bacterium]